MQIRWFLLILVICLIGCVAPIIVSSAGDVTQPSDPVWTVAPATLSGASDTQGIFTWSATGPITELKDAMNLTWVWPVPTNVKFISGTLDHP